MALPKQQRMYIPLWEAIKKHKVVSVTAPKHLHKRIKQAVKKEKCYDVAYTQREGWRMEYLTFSSQGNVLTFFLNYKLTDILSKDL